MKYTDRTSSVSYISIKVQADYNSFSQPHNSDFHEAMAILFYKHPAHWHNTQSAETFKIVTPSFMVKGLVHSGQNVVI